jgi:hypothetical protein
MSSVWLKRTISPLSFLAGRTDRWTSRFIALLISAQ